MHTHRLGTGGDGTVMLLVGLSDAAPPHAETRCTYLGAPANLMTVSVSGQWLGVISRRGSKIVAGDYATGPQPCSGGTPTVTNTDTIEVLLSDSDLAYVEVLLANGPLAPGGQASSAREPPRSTGESAGGAPRWMSSAPRVTMTFAGLQPPRIRG